MVTVRVIHPPYSLLDGIAERLAPQTVREHARAAGALVWMDPGAAANRLRSAVEKMLDNLEDLDDKDVPSMSNLSRRIDKAKSDQLLELRLTTCCTGCGSWAILVPTPPPTSPEPT